jgi:hypothetical protein
MIKFPAELPQLTVRVIPPKVPSVHENLLVARLGGVRSSISTKMAMIHSFRANLAKE